MNFAVNISVFIFALLCLLVNAHAESKIIVIGKNNDGRVSGEAYLKKENVWTEAGIEKRKFEPFSDHVLRDGTAMFYVPPGKYKVNVYDNETSAPSYSKHSDEFFVTDQDEVVKEFYFEKGEIKVVGKDSDGGVSGEAYLKKQNIWSESGIEKQEFEPFSDHVLRDGTAMFTVPPGKYKVIVYDNDTSGPSSSKHSDEFFVADQDEVVKEFYFEKGDIKVVGKDNDGWASGRVYLKKEKVWIEAGIEKRKFEPYSDRSLRGGTAMFSVPPGQYKLITYHNNRKRYPNSIEQIIHAVDHDVITITMDFNSTSSTVENNSRVQQELTK
jgi:hypothetical protein